MPRGFYTERFQVEYVESQVDSFVLWESHCHARFEMIIVLEGDINVMLEGRNYRLTGGQTAIIPPLSYHTVTANGKGIYRRVTVLFDGDTIPAALRTRFLEKEAVFEGDVSHGEGLRRLCDAEESQFYAPLAESFMVQILYRGYEARERNVAEEDGFLRQVLSYIDGHLCEDLSLDALAEYTSRSRSSFCHLFKERMKISPGQYIVQKKLALANKLIGDGVPPTVAAIQVGYDNYSNFYRMYRKHFGYAPANRG